MNDTVDDVLAVAQSSPLQTNASACGAATFSQWKDYIDDLSKRAFDLVIASIGIVVLLPLVGVLTLALIVFQGAPIFIAHQRIGRNGRPFRCLKFRTMVLDADRVLASHLASSPQAAAEWQTTRKLRDDPRITSIGRVLRRSSVDEIPQLVNVVRGEMSLVGPRPIVESEKACYGAAIEHYLAARPGLTGAWQVAGRNEVDYARRVELDADYVESRTFFGDLRIILKTIPAVIRTRGAM